MPEPSKSGENTEPMALSKEEPEAEVKRLKGEITKLAGRLKRVEWERTVALAALSSLSAEVETLTTEVNAALGHVFKKEFPPTDPADVARAKEYDKTCGALLTELAGVLDSLKIRPDYESDFRAVAGYLNLPPDERTNS